MANLITENQKKIIKSEYYFRLSGLVLFVFSLLGVFILIYITLYYFYISKNDDLVGEQIKTAIDIENRENVGENFLGIISRTLDEQKVVDFYQENSLKISSILKIVVDQKGQDISLRRLVIDSKNKASQRLVISGLAKNRQNLVDFVEKLKVVEIFTSVESPISGLAKDSDINFTVNVNVNI